MADEKRKGEPSDDVSSAPESGTVRGPTSGNKPSHADKRGNLPDDKGHHHPGDEQISDDPSTAPAER